MNLFVEYMSFDFSWFTTVPGILITLGLVCLLIGLVFLILSGKKDKGEEKNEASVDAKTEEKPVVEATTNEVSAPTVEPAPVVQAETNVLSVSEEVPTTPEVVNSESVVATPEVVVPAVEPAVVAVAAENNAVAETPVEPVTVETPVENVVDQVTTPVTPEVVVPAVETPVQESTVSIYGGANPQVNLAPTEEPKKVYGGADPLENTGALPRVEVPVEPVVVEVEVKAPAVENTPEVVVPTAEAPAVPIVETVDTTSPVAPSGDIETLEF